MEGTGCSVVNSKKWHIFDCPYCSFKTRIWDIMQEHMKTHPNPILKKPGFNPSRR